MGSDYAATMGRRISRVSVSPTLPSAAGRDDHHVVDSTAINVVIIANVMGMIRSRFRLREGLVPSKYTRLSCVRMCCESLNKQPSRIEPITEHNVALAPSTPLRGYDFRGEAMFFRKCRLRGNVSLVSHQGNGDQKEVVSNSGSISSRLSSMENNIEVGMRTRMANFEAFQGNT